MSWADDDDRGGAVRQLLVQLGIRKKAEMSGLAGRQATNAMDGRGRVAARLQTVALCEFVECVGRHQSFPGRASSLRAHARSEEHTSELQSLMRISYAVFCLKKKKKKNIIRIHIIM